MECQDQLGEKIPGYASALHHDHAEIQIEVLSGGLGCFSRSLSSGRFGISKS